METTLGLSILSKINVDDMVANVQYDAMAFNSIQDQLRSFPFATDLWIRNFQFYPRSTESLYTSTFDAVLLLPYKFFLSSKRITSQLLSIQNSVNIIDIFHISRSQEISGFLY